MSGRGSLSSNTGRQGPMAQTSSNFFSFYPEIPGKMISQLTPIMNINYNNKSNKLQQQKVPIGTNKQTVANNKKKLIR